MRSIQIGLSPNLRLQDVVSTINIIFHPFLWQKGKSIPRLENWFKKYFSTKYAIAFNSGRSAFYTILQSLNFKKNDEVLCQAYTCVAVPNSIIWSGLKPIYVDIDKSLNIDIQDAEKKISNKTKALIVQHTFGIPANLKQIINFCHKHNLLLIEDTAHALGATYQDKLVGTFGDVAFFSFGRDKVISSVFGGMVITNNIQLGNKILQMQKQLDYPSYYWIFQQLLHPIISFISLYLYNFFYIGKLILFTFQKLGLLSYPVDKIEKTCCKPHIFPQKLPNALACLALIQLTNLSQFNKHRIEIANLYYSQFENNNHFSLPEKSSGAIYLRFNLLTKKAGLIRNHLRKKNITLGNWYSQIIDPHGVDYKLVKYVEKSCPQAESYSKQSLNLPTYPNLTYANAYKITDLIKKYDQ